MPPAASRPLRNRDVITVGLNPAIDRVVEVPNFAIGGHVTGTQKSHVAAGKSLNVSRVLARLGIPNVATGFVGAEDVAMFEEAIEDLPISPQFFKVPGRTRENITLLDPVNRAETHVRTDGFAPREPDVRRLSSKLSMLASETAIIVLAGSVPSGLVADVFPQLLATLIRSNARVIVDSSGTPLSQAIEAGVWLIKPNEQELAEFVGRALPDTDSRVAAARELLSRVPNVLLSCGEDGVFHVTAERTWHAWCRVDSGALRSTVGAGDALLAGYIAAVQRKQSPDECLRQAAAVASASLSSLESGNVDVDRVTACLASAEVAAFA